MKTIIQYLANVVALIIFCTTFSACSSDDDSNGGDVVTSLTSSTGSIGGHDYVDLGLSVSWATCNVGANVPEAYGDYLPFFYAGVEDVKNAPQDISGTKWDWATHLWGNAWRLPTASEMYELLNCKWETVTYRNTKGARVTGPNGNSIFIPFAGNSYYDERYLSDPINGPFTTEMYNVGEALILRTGCKSMSENSYNSMEHYVTYQAKRNYVSAVFPWWDDDSGEHGMLTFASTGDSNGSSIRPVTKTGATGTAGSGGSSGSTGGGSSSSYEKPDIGLQDYTCYKTSMKVVYKIYNKDEAKVTSAKIYYGTSSPTKSVSASVSSATITGNISGLKAGTTYYIKCVATGKGGTTTSEVTKLVTNY